LRYSDAQRTTSTDGYIDRWPCMPVRVGDVRRVASSVAIVEPIASPHLSPLTALAARIASRGHSRTLAQASGSFR
jgi:hypothetical protein